MSLIEVRPIEKIKWHKKTKEESFARPITIEVLYNPKTGKYATGLTKEEEEEFGKRLGVNLSSDFTESEPHPYYSTKAAWITLENRTQFFDTSNLRDYIKVQNMKASPQVANSMEEYEKGLWPEATHVIYDEREEVEKKAKEADLKGKLYADIYQLSAEKRAAIVQILSDKTVRGMSPSFITVEIENLIETKPLEVAKLLKEKEEDIFVRSQVMEALARRILTKDQGKICYMGEPIAFDVDEAVAWFKDPENQTLKLRILEKLV